MGDGMEDCECTICQRGKYAPVKKAKSATTNPARRRQVEQIRAAKERLTNMLQAVFNSKANDKPVNVMYLDIMSCQEDVNYLVRLATRGGKK